MVAGLFVFGCGLVCLCRCGWGSSWRRGSHPEQGWSLLCNGVVAFDDTASTRRPAARLFQRWVASLHAHDLLAAEPALRRLQVPEISLNMQGELADVFDGNEHIVAVVIQRPYMRQVRPLNAALARELMTARRPVADSGSGSDRARN